MIIDPWCGDSGYADIMLKNMPICLMIFQIEKGEDIQFVKRHSLDLSDEDIKFFKKNYPELVFKSSDKHKLFTEV